VRQRATKLDANSAYISNSSSHIKSKAQFFIPISSIHIKVPVNLVLSTKKNNKVTECILDLEWCFPEFQAEEFLFSAQDNVIRKTQKSHCCYHSNEGIARLYARSS